jgi:hypothetical protein
MRACALPRPLRSRAYSAFGVLYELNSEAELMIIAVFGDIQDSP